MRPCRVVGVAATASEARQRVARRAKGRGRLGPRALLAHRPLSPFFPLAAACKAPPGRADPGRCQPFFRGDRQPFYAEAGW